MGQVDANVVTYEGRAVNKMIDASLDSLASVKGAACRIDCNQMWAER